MNKKIYRKYFCFLLFVVISLSLLAGVSLSDSDNDNDKISSDIAFLTSERQHAEKYADDLKKAWRAFDISDTDRAEKIFKKVLNAKDAAEVERVQALFGLGTNYQFAVPKEKPDKARECFQRILDEYPDNSIAVWSLLKMGVLEGTDSAEARERGRQYYNNVLQRHPGSLAIHEAALRLAGGYFYELEPEMAAKGIQTLEEHMEKYPDNPLASVMLFRLQFWYAEVNRDYDKSVEYGLELGEFMMADPQRWGIQLWSLAQMMRIRQNRPVESLKWYKKIVEVCHDYPFMVLSAKEIINEITMQQNEKE